jgi:glutathionyl-hydroquinone reductase
MSSVEAEVKAGRFVRQANRFTDPLSPAEPGRYQLYVSYACPWAHRTLIVRHLLGLSGTIGVTVVDPIRDERGWRFPERDPVTGAEFLSQLYLATDPSFQGRYTVPCVWDKTAERLVTNDFPAITIAMETEFTAYHRPDAPDLYPAELRPEIDSLNEIVYRNVNNGVYRSGFASSQAAYEEAVTELFETLDMLEARLEGHEFLVGDRLTEADVRLYPTLARFDIVYHAHFKCNLRRLADYPNLWAYARRLYAQPAFHETTNFDHIKRHYYVTQTNINPSGVYPLGPVIDWSL